MMLYVLLGVVVAVALWLVSCVLRKRGTTLIIAGPVNAGKTTLFYQLKDGSDHNGVVASMQENAAVCALSTGKGATAKQVRILDVPGHHSFRHRLEASMKDAAGVVFLVDAVEITPHKLEAADMLYEVLTNPQVHKQRIPILVACNKADLEEEAHSMDFIRKTLEKQLDAMRKTKTAAIGKDAGSQVPALGALDKPFSLQSLRNKISFVECSAKQGQLDDVRAFIGSCF
eukprot:gene3523-3793_t